MLYHLAHCYLCLRQSCRSWALGGQKPFPLELKQA
uniref:Uncharacterized protein n=1 Tax=Arundo donax TaxID=35708 RepID=A0A0A9GFU2_ARUDO